MAISSRHRRSSLSSRAFAWAGWLLVGLLSAAPSWGADYSFSGFGTVGYSQSNRSYAYQRFISDSGTFNRDSLFGAQMDVTFDNQFGATVQAKVAPSLESDNKTDLTASWAFVSWRPNNDWLVRVGKLRVPIYLYSENMDVGTTYDVARLPYEVYSLSPSNDLNGMFFSRSWSTNSGDWNLDGYWGQANLQWRFYHRDSVPGLQEPGPFAAPIKIESAGLSLNFRKDDNLFLFGLHQARARGDGQAFVGEFGYNSGVYTYAGSSHPDVIIGTSYVLGAAVSLPRNFRLTGEAVRRVVQETRIGPDTYGAYVSLSNNIGAWTPYVTYALLHSRNSVLGYYQAINSNTVPSFVPGADLINASQRMLADGIISYDQHSWAVGFSYALSPTSKIKAEWQRMHIGKVSSLVDAPSGSNISDTSINVLSASYNFVF